MAKIAIILTVLCLLAVTQAVPQSKKITKIHKRQAPVAGQCGNNEFTCRNGECIQLEWTCDTEDDCSDMSDEQNCPTDCTGAHQFHCSSGSCIPIEYRCDGDPDCDGHADDEAGCDTMQCNLGEVKCSNNICIEKDYLCDGDNDCGNGWDEIPANCQQ